MLLLGPLLLLQQDSFHPQQAGVLLQDQDRVQVHYYHSRPHSRQSESH